MSRLAGCLSVLTLGSRLRVGLGFTLAVCAAGFVVRAQQPTDSPQPTFRGGTDIVQLDVTVVDKERHPVRGLTAEDFTVLEDGKPTPVVAFVPMNLPAPELPPAPWMRDVAPDIASNDFDAKRIVVIVMDDAYTGRDRAANREESWSPWIAKAGKRIGHDVIDSLGPGDLAAVLFTFMGRQQNFTTDRAKLGLAVDSFAPKDSPSLGPPLGCGYKGAGQTGCVLDALKRVADMLPASPPRRKVIIFVSQTFAVPDLNFDTVRTNADSLGTGLTELQQMVRALQRNNTTIFAIDPGGLQTGGVSGARQLQMLSELTGGRAFSQTNAPWEGVPQVFEETGSYYLIGFPSSRADGKFHPIKVTVNRRDVDVRTRSGYFAEPAAAAKAKTRKKIVTPLTPVELALTRGMPVGDLPLKAAVAAFGVPGQRNATIAVVSNIHQPPAEGRTTQSVKMIISAYDKDWQPQGAQTQTVDLALRPNVEGDLHYETLTRLTLPPGRYELRVAADSLGKTGSVFADLEVPDFGKAPLSLSGLVVGTTPAIASAPSGTFRDLLPVVPTARREFRTADRVATFVRVYEGRAGTTAAVHMTARIVGEDNRTVFEETRPLPSGAFAATRATDYLLDLPVARLAPGEYLLTIAAEAGKTTTQRTLRFTLVK